jgi:hypothetical protein
MPARVDAIVVPGGPGNRLDAAIKLAEQNRARYLLLSVGEYIPPQLCGSHVGSAAVLRLDRPCHVAGSDAACGTSVRTLLQRKDLRGHHAVAEVSVAIPDRLPVGCVYQGRTRESGLLTSAIGRTVANADTHESI